MQHREVNRWKQKNQQEETRVKGPNVFVIGIPLRDNRKDEVIMHSKRK